MQQFAAFFFFTLLLSSCRPAGCCACQRLSFAATLARLVAWTFCQMRRSTLLQANMIDSEATIRYDVEDKCRRVTWGCATPCSVGVLPPALTLRTTVWNLSRLLLMMPYRRLQKSIGEKLVISGFHNQLASQKLNRSMAGFLICDYVWHTWNVALLFFAQSHVLEQVIFHNLWKKIKW